MKKLKKPFLKQILYGFFLNLTIFVFTVNYIKPYRDQQYALLHWVMKYFTDENLFCELFLTSLLEIRAHRPVINIIIYIFV